MNINRFEFSVANLEGLEKWFGQVYVAGFLFRNGGKEVAMVKKEKPQWQRGRLNGIGGKVEIGESPGEAMRREFQEETGADITDWRPFCVLEGKSREWAVVWYVSHQTAEIKTMEEEEIGWRFVELIATWNCIPNIRWLVPLALDKDSVIARVIDPL